jgi:hypothetical protein
MFTRSGGVVCEWWERADPISDPYSSSCFILGREELCKRRGGGGKEKKTTDGKFARAKTLRAGGKIFCLLVVVRTE